MVTVRLCLSGTGIRTPMPGRAGEDAPVLTIRCGGPQGAPHSWRTLYLKTRNLCSPVTSPLYVEVSYSGYDHANRCSFQYSCFPSISNRFGSRFIPWRASRCPGKAGMESDGGRLRRERFQVPVGGDAGGVEAALPNAGDAGAGCARTRDECSFDFAWNGRNGGAVFVAAVC